MNRDIPYYKSFGAGFGEDVFAPLQEPSVDLTESNFLLRRGFAPHIVVAIVWLFRGQPAGAH